MAKTGSRGYVLSPEVLSAALSGLEAKRSRLDDQIARVRSLLGAPRRGRPAAAAADSAASIATPPKKRRMSAAGRKRIALAAKRRWAEWKKKQK